MGKTLSQHAEYELKKLGLHLDSDPRSKKILTDTIALVRRFEKQEHDDYTGKWVSDFFDRLVHFEGLSPITDDPDEWEAYEDTHKNLKTGEAEVTKRWQSTRVPAIVSMDGGKTFINLATDKSGESVDHIEQAKKWEEERLERQKAKDTPPAPPAPVQGQSVLAHPPVDTSVPAGEEAGAAQTAPPSKEETDKTAADTTQSEKN